MTNRLENADEIDTFIEEKDLDNSTIEKILRNTFHDTLLLSSEEEEATKIDWTEVFSTRKNIQTLIQHYAPGLKPVPQYPKLSSLTSEQHYQCLTVLSFENPNIYPNYSYPKPSKQDYKLLEELHEKYVKEQVRYLDWAKLMWLHSNSVRALRPKPAVEQIYESRFLMNVRATKSLPKYYALSGQIPIRWNLDGCDMVHIEDLVELDLSNLPQMSLPELNKQISVLNYRPPPVGVCNVHPCQFLMPDENEKTTMSLADIQEELALYALKNGCQYIVSEGALRCLLQQDCYWTLPLSVHRILGDGNDYKTVFVIGNEILKRKQPGRTRTYYGYRHLLELYLIAEKEGVPIPDSSENDNTNDTVQDDNSNNSSDDEDKLVMNISDSADSPIDSNDPQPGTSKQFDDGNNAKPKPFCDTGDDLDNDVDEQQNTETEHETNDDDGEEQNGECEIDEDAVEDEDEPQDEDMNKNDSCTCKDTYFEKPPKRTFSKWRILTSDHYYSDIIVHCTHRIKDRNEEIVVDPLPEYQLELGGTLYNECQLKSLALALHLRKKAKVLSVRVDAVTGDLVTYEFNDSKDIRLKYGGDAIPEVADVIYSTLKNFETLRPGRYVLQHKPEHGANAMLYVALSTPTAGADSWVLESNKGICEEEEEQSLRTPPRLGPVLLPYHKYRKILPLAFTPYVSQMAREATQKQTIKVKQPPPGLTWPKRKRKRNRKRKSVVRY